MKKALVLSLAAVLCLGFASFAEDLFGTWDTLVCYTNVDAADCCPVLSTTLIVNYEICGWTFTSTTKFDLTNGWTDQTFGAVGQVGGFVVGSTVDFNPATVLFEKWTVTTNLDMLNVDLGFKFVLVPNDVTLTLTASGGIDCVDVTGTITFGAVGGGCDFDWQGVKFVATFPFDCADITATVEFDCTGFKYAQFCAMGLAFPTIDWVTIDVCFKFTVDAKTYTLTTNFDFGVEGCVDLILSEPTAIFGDITIDGVSLEATIGGVDFVGISYWGDAANEDKPGILADTDYWEAYQFSSSDDGCCGLFTFSLAVFFLENGTQLFDIAEIDTFFDIEISEQFTLGMTLAVDLEALEYTWCLHFLVEW
jgi:hypothetical protein